MSNIYQTINQNMGSYLCVTVLEGPQAGEKALLVKGELASKPADGGLLEKHRELLANRNETGILSLDGLRVFTEYFSGIEKLVICGAGTVSQALIPLAKAVDFQVTVLEDRQEYADKALELGADRVICRDFEDALAEIPGDETTYFVVLTRDHSFDTQCLRLIFEKEKAYVGMMGSKKRVRLLKENFLAEGIRAGEIEALHAPIGLSIGARTPAEIAISIVAELLQVKNTRSRTEGFDHKLLKALQEGLSAGKQAVLAEIVDRTGSTPRGVGAKMLIWNDGTCTGSIGGGAMEADVVKEASVMLQSGTLNMLYDKDIDHELGMLCGGSQLIWMERIV